MEKREMEKVRNDALAYYNCLSKKKKKAVSKFFRALDNDRNGTINLDELAEFLADKGVYIDDSPVDTFKKFDQDGNGTLDFDEVITLFYYLTVGPGAKQWTVRRGSSKNLDKWKEAREAMEYFTASFNFGAVVGATLATAAVAGGCSIM